MAVPKMTANYFVGFSHSNSCRPISSIQLALKDISVCRTLLASVILRYSHCKIADQLFSSTPFLMLRAAARSVAAVGERW